MKKLIIMAAIAVCAMGFSEAQAQKIIKDASGNVFMDMEGVMGVVTSGTLDKIGIPTELANRIYNKLQIAKDDLPTTMSWAEAVGFSAAFNSSIAKGMSQGQLNTGCKAYSAEGNAGKWRVPTQKELIMMFILTDHLKAAGVSFASSFYWCSVEWGDSHSWLINFNNSTSNAYAKADANNVRCVREVN